MVEVILSYRSKVSSEYPYFTPTCDSCDCGFPVHSPLLVLFRLWQLEPSLSHLFVFACHYLFCSLPVSFSPSLLHFFSVSDKLTRTSISSACLCPTPSLRDFVCFMFSSAEKTLVYCGEISSLKFLMKSNNNAA